MQGNVVADPGRVLDEIEKVVREAQENTPERKPTQSFWDTGTRPKSSVLNKVDLPTLETELESCLRETAENRNTPVQELVRRLRKVRYKNRWDPDQRRMVKVAVDVGF